MLQEEGAALYRAGNFERAAEKFKASIAAQPSARAYLGYAQALEALGKIALGYEQILEAKKLSDVELATTPTDVDVLGRAERVKFKVAELQARVATVTVTLPDFVKPDELVSVQRKDEGDIVEPLSKPILIAANKQEMVATLKDGRSVTFTVSLAPGTTGTTVLPFPAPAPKQVVIEKPTTTIIQQFVAERRATKIAAIEIGTVGPNDNVDFGWGGFLRLDLRRFEPIEITGRVGGLYHGRNTLQFSAVEVAAHVGAHWTPVSIFHLDVEVGMLLYSRSAQVDMTVNNQTFAYPTIAVGAGLRLDRLDIRVAGMKHFEIGNVVAMPLRILLTFGVEVLRR